MKKRHKETWKADKESTENNYMVIIWNAQNEN